MFSKAEAAQLRQEFWTTLGRYLRPILGADGDKVNWINYKTGIKFVYFRMEAENRSARIAIEITHYDTGIQELFYEQFAELRNILNGYLNEDWTWELHHQDLAGKIISRIYTELPKTSIYNREDWPKLISFFKPRIIALDEFWSVAKYSFDALK
ncbi:DUF4268 domain-containing protein [Mucilaginibacter myungsuensis]|uniref:DUF4268 domain-containing protein n=1 Tax=Mucilaginibacter myungsuensis TaxID=649104 RepID=A0A929KT73_9SPHI|nr:DUF4268 domain-containing protein [Mucilaginibacter myungsuensis]MBE9660362.1 DUF4268 domain-containing protein [Mucilaginibacter myungsuensis]MDN3600404.1 DUF4268 domain-containing protein [Mucilaginibacter myungsuensis]